VIPGNASGSIITGNMPSCNIAEYRSMSLGRLEAKIRQYPRGSKFVMSPVWPETEDQRKLEDEIRATFEKYGMSLETHAS
jgi:hypothetical protein